jgi:hypothetical protein
MFHSEFTGGSDFNTWVLGNTVPPITTAGHHPQVAENTTEVRVHMLYHGRKMGSTQCLTPGPHSMSVSCHLSDQLHWLCPNSAMIYCYPHPSGGQDATCLSCVHPGIEFHPCPTVYGGATDLTRCLSWFLNLPTASRTKLRIPKRHTFTGDNGGLQFSTQRWNQWFLFLTSSPITQALSQPLTRSSKHLWI